MKDEIFEKYPVGSGLGIIVGVVTLFGLLGFHVNNLVVIAFFTAIILVVVYFDHRIKKLEQRNSEKESFNKDGKVGLSGMKLNKKGITSFVWMIIIILILILLYFLFTFRNPS